MDWKPGRELRYIIQPHKEQPKLQQMWLRDKIDHNGHVEIDADHQWRDVPVVLVQ